MEKREKPTQRNQQAVGQLAFWNIADITDQGFHSRGVTIINDSAMCAVWAVSIQAAGCKTSGATFKFRRHLKPRQLH